YARTPALTSTCRVMRTGRLIVTASGHETGVDAAERVHRVRDVLVRMCRRERQGEHFAPCPLRHGQRRLVREVLAVVRERVHREEVNARADVLLRERALVGVAVGT